ncbi:MAG: hypothetical protein PVF75_06905 [Granulosicoccaceae bacterium]|jgi:chorismate mutase
MKYTTISLVAAMLLAGHAIAEEKSADESNEAANNAYEQKLGECMKQANDNGVSDDALDSFLENCVSSQKEEG